MLEINCMGGMARRVVRAKVAVEMEFLVGGEDDADRVDSVRMALDDHYDDAVKSSFWRDAIAGVSVLAVDAEADNPEGAASQTNKLRKALEKLLDVLYDMGVDENTLAIAIESPNCHMKSEHTLAVLKEARAALAEPVRNCDMGTPEEQSIRFDDYCHSRKNSGNCRNCALNETLNFCALEWAQMPYEGKETT